MMLRVLVAILGLTITPTQGRATELWAGAAKMEITDRDAGPVNDPSYAKALVLRSGETIAVIVTIDAVAIGEIGRIGNDFLGTLRSQLEQELGIPPENVIVNASHCHSLVRADTDALTVQAVKAAFQNMVQVRVGAGRGRESEISENRRLQMKDGSEVDMRRAYSMPQDAEVASVGPIDPEIGLMRIDRLDGKPLAVLYNFACHPIMGAANGGNTAGFPGFASRVIEDALDDGVMAFFVQGCAGDINPVRYKTVAGRHDGAPLGHQLGQSVLHGIQNISTVADAKLKVIRQVISLPRGADLDQRIAAIQSERSQLVQSLKPTDINFKSFLPLLIQYQLSSDFPLDYSQAYLHESAQGREDLKTRDVVNRGQLQAYLENINIMERLTRLNVNLALLEKHQRTIQSAGAKPLEVEVVGIRVGDFHLLTFPGELTVEIGLGIKRRSPVPLTFVAGYTNGYIYYTPTEKQRRNTGYAQEDCDCLVAPEWQQVFEQKALEIINSL